MVSGMDKRLRFMTDLIAPLKVAPGSEVRLSRDHDPGYTGGVARPQAAALLADGVELLADYQDRLAAQDTFGVLLVLQGIDAAGKDSTIKHVMSGVNPQAVEVRAFKQPSAEELNHDFLWRYQRALPGRGRIGIFNRSHYEEVLVVRVHEELLAAERMPAVAVPGGHGIWARRYREINDWERYLVDNGIHVVKVMLNLSKREQAKRFLKRIDHPEKNWKFSPSDVRERRYWDDYQRAFEAMLSQTSTKWAPWYVVPADHKWFSRLATAAVLVTALDAINPRYPAPDPAVADQMAQVREELAAELGRTGPGWARLAKSSQSGRTGTSSIRLVRELPDLLMWPRARAASLGRSGTLTWGGTVMSDLIVIGYPDEETAEKVWDELVKLQADYLVDLEDAAIIRRDRKGRLHVTTPAHHAVTWGTLSGLFWGVLIGLIFLWPLAPVVGVAGGIMGAALGAAGDLGIKDEFRQRVQDMLQPGTSAIMVIVRKVTPDKFIETLKPYGGMVLKTSLPHDAEQQLMKALHGDDPSAPTWQQPASAGAQA